LPASTANVGSFTAALADERATEAVLRTAGILPLRNATLYERLAAMTTAGLVVRFADGYSRHL
jgi:hypothetical protein